MSDDTGNVIGVRTVYDAVLRLEGKLDAQAARFEQEMDAHKEAVAEEVAAVKGELTYLRGKIDGSLGLLRWLGPAGVVGVGFAIAKANGLV